MTTTAQQIRAWQGPAILSFGFRPFFLGAACWAVLAMMVWIPMLSGALSLPTSFYPVGWHAHEFLFGYLGAVVAGFLLTAMPNWTGRLPIVGWPLAALFALWLIGRSAVAVSLYLSPLVVALADLTLPLVLASVIAREIVAGRNWRNLIVLAMLAVFAASNAVFHWEAAQGADPARGYGLRLGLAGALTMIAVSGGRIVPSFTRNWLVRRGPGRLPAPPMQRFDRLALLVLIAALALWVIWPEASATGLALLLAGLLHLLRLARWCGDRTWPEPLVFVLHVGYALLPVGSLAMALSILMPGKLDMAAAQHVWMAGTIGLMTLAVMTRATLGHTGRALSASVGTSAIYFALLAALVTRLSAGIWPAQAATLHTLAALAWMGAFGGFAALYGPFLLRPKPEV